MRQCTALRVPRATRGTPSGSNPARSLPRFHEVTPIAKKRSPETFEKRRRAFDKQRKRAEKLAERIARNAAKRDGTNQTDTADAPPREREDTPP